jgi:hypothetical protein
MVCRITRPLLPPATPLGEVPFRVLLVRCICFILTQNFLTYGSKRRRSYCLYNL